MFIALLIFDALCLMLVAVLSYRRLTFHHPLTVYLFFHVYCFTERAWAIFLGAPTMYSVGYSSQYEPITIAEISRGLFYADLALISFALGIFWIGRRFTSPGSVSQTVAFTPINVPILHFISAACILIGSVTFFLVRGGRVDLSGFALANYLGVSTMWPITGLIIVYYLTRILWIVIIPAALYLSVVALQGYHRFMLVLPILSLIAVYLIKEKRKWPPVYILLLIAPILLVFPFLKGIGKSVIDGDIAFAREQAAVAFSMNRASALQDSSGFLDQMAGFLTLCDRHPRYEYGITYLRILTLPIPRTWWPGKPGMADHLIERSTPSRPYGKEGRVTTHVGQAYVNFGTLGVIAMPFIFGSFLGWFYETITRAPYHSLGVLMYIFLSSSFIQAYRDGFNSVILFGLVFNMPLIFIWFAHLGVPKRLLPSAGFRY
jgi:hypothetical protein